MLIGRLGSQTKLRSESYGNQNRGLLDQAMRVLAKRTLAKEEAVHQGAEAGLLRKAQHAPQARTCRSPAPPPQGGASTASPVRRFDLPTDTLGWLRER
jgi:hypothetical protein